MRWFVLLVTLVITLGACGDDQSPPTDAGGVGPTLEILEPPGDSIGLAHGDRATLRVRLRDAGGVPSTGAMVGFAIAADADAGGSALSAPEAATDGDGVATVELTAGASRAIFVVTATAESAPPVAFTIAVAPGGFAAIDVFPSYEGARDDDVTTRRVRLVPGLRCVDLDPDALPPTPYPTRTVAAWGARATFRAVPAGEPATVIAWAEPLNGVVLAIACLELDGPQLRADSTLRLDPLVRDRAARLGATLALRSVIDVRPALGPTVAPGGLWSTLGCGAGVGQVVLDAALAELAVDDARRVAIEAARATRDPATGCRVGDGTPDALAHDVLTRGAPGAALGDTAAALDALARAVTIDSTLIVDGVVATHRLRSLRAGDETLDLVASARPRIETRGVGVSVDRDGLLTIETHAVAAWPGDLLRRAVRAAALAPAGVPPAPAPILPSVLAEASDGTRTGCAAVSAAVCTSVALAESCLEAACGGAIGPLETTLDAPFARFAITGDDLSWRGVARVVDDDVDLVADGVTGGLWSGLITVTDGAAGVTASFASPAP